MYDTGKLRMTRRINLLICALALLLVGSAHATYGFDFPIVLEDSSTDPAPYIAELYRLPSPVLDAYNATLSIGPYYVDAWNEETGAGAAAVCFYPTGHIAVTAPQYIAHEMGHFWDLCLGFPLCIYHLYWCESDALAEATGWSYCKTDRYEFFAEAFALYVNDPVRLKVYCPKTYEQIRMSMKGKGASLEFRGGI